MNVIYIMADDHAFQGARRFACYHIFVQRTVVVSSAWGDCTATEVLRSALLSHSALPDAWQGAAMHLPQ